VRCRRGRSRRPSTTSAAPQRPPSRQAPTAWRSTAPTATWCTSSCPTTPTSAPTATAALEGAAVADEIGADRTGLRVSPGNPYNDIVESDTAELYPALLRALSPLGLAYLHVLHAGDDALLGTLRALWPTTLILNRGGTDLPTRAKDIDHGTADLVSVGALALANPDLVERLRSDAPLNTPDPATFYGGGAAGYTDYPTHTA
jgi:N-ethylmaleimide reductase